MWAKNWKVISLVALCLIIGAALLRTFVTDPAQLGPSINHTEDHFSPHQFPSVADEINRPPEKSSHTAKDNNQNLSPEMRRAINQFVGKGRAEPEIERLKGGGNITRLAGRYRHVTVITIDAAGDKHIQEYGPHGVQEEE